MDLYGCANLAPKIELSDGACTSCLQAVLREKLLLDAQLQEARTKLWDSTVPPSGSHTTQMQECSNHKDGCHRCGCDAVSRNTTMTQDEMLMPDPESPMPQPARTQFMHGAVRQLSNAHLQLAHSQPRLMAPQLYDGGVPAPGQLQRGSGSLLSLQVSQTVRQGPPPNGGMGVNSGPPPVLLSFNSGTQ